MRQKYIGYWSDNFTWFDSASKNGASETRPSIDIDPRGDNFSYRWTGYFTPTSTGTYYFKTRSDDASAVKIDGDVIVDNLGAHGPRDRKGSVSVVANTHYAITVYYGEKGGGASMRMWWKGGSQSSWTETFDSQFSATDGNCAALCVKAITRNNTVHLVPAKCDRREPRFLCGEEDRHCRMKEICAHMGPDRSAAPTGCLFESMDPFTLRNGVTGGDLVVVEMRTTGTDVKATNFVASVVVRQFETKKCFAKINNHTLAPDPSATRSTEQHNSLDAALTACVEAGKRCAGIEERVDDEGSRYMLKLQDSRAALASAPRAGNVQTNVYVNTFC